MFLIGLYWLCLAPNWTLFICCLVLYFIRNDKDTKGMSTYLRCPGAPLDPCLVSRCLLIV